MKKFIHFTAVAALILVLTLLPAFAIPPETAESSNESENSPSESSESAQKPAPSDTGNYSESLPLPRPHPEILSPGILNIAAKCKMKVSSIAGTSVQITEEDFLRALNKKFISTITITSLPSPAEGELMLGGYSVKVGDIISGNDISKLEFIPAGVYITHSSFSFKEGENNYEIGAYVYLLSKENSVPVVRDITVGTSVSTYRELSYFGHLPGFDPDGDSIEFMVVDYPKKGAIRLDPASGKYEYLPEKGFTGRDSFEYVIRDRFGAYAASETVYIDVDSLHEDELFDDMEKSSSYAEAILLARSGILGGRTVGGNRLFLPESNMTRGEFISAVMKASDAEIRDNILHTQFADDSDIPTSMKGAVAAAYELGYIKGFEVEGKLLFRPDEEITLAECASVIEKILGIESEETVPVFSFIENCPEDAIPAVNLLCSVSVLPQDREGLNANEKLTREYAAKLLLNVKTFIKLHGDS